MIKEANKYLVMQCIQAFEPVTLEKIAEKTLLSRPTILEIINSFKEEGIVVNCETGNCGQTENPV